MEDINKYILDAIQVVIKKFLKNLKYNYYVTGKITSVNSDGTYGVQINGVVSNLPARPGSTFSVGDVVYVMVVNGNYSFKFVDCKKPAGL
jgi:ribosomal protein S1